MQDRLAVSVENLQRYGLLQVSFSIPTNIDHSLSNSSLLSAATFPVELRPNLPNEPNDDKLLKLLLHSPRLKDFLVLLGFVGLNSNSISLASVLLLATANRVMLLRQKGQTGILAQLIEELGLL